MKAKIITSTSVEKLEIELNKFLVNCSKVQSIDFQIRPGFNQDLVCALVLYEKGSQK